jgi:putative tricarboxylic transport membrane protein
LAALAAVVAWNTRNIGGGGGYAQIGPKAFPYAIAIMLAVLSRLNAAVRLARRVSRPATATRFPPVLWIVGGPRRPALLLPYLGFSIATGLLFRRDGAGVRPRPALVHAAARHCAVAGGFPRLQSSPQAGASRRAT